MILSRGLIDRLARLQATLICSVALGAPTVTNVALDKPATGSSVYPGSPPSQFSDGNDGNRDGQYYSGLSVFHTAIPEHYPPSHWEVDLGADFTLDRVMIWPRTDVTQHTIVRFRLSARDAADTVVWQQSFMPSPANSVWGTSSMRGRVGRRLRFERLDQNPDFITFAEFEVWGSAQAVPVNLALNRPVSASPAGPDTPPARGNDGNLDGDYTLPGNPIYQSATAAAGQFWQVDLGAEQPIDYVTLFNRTEAAPTTSVRLSVRDAAQTEVYAAVLPDISRNVIVAGGAQFDVTHDLPGAVQGRFVRVETTRAEPLAFTELEVFGPVADTIPPSLSATEPPPGTLLAELLAVEALFSEDVVGVDASDLLVNGTPASTLVSLTSRRYAFTFPPPVDGPVAFSWASGHGIADTAGNAYPDTGWSVTLNTALPPPNPVITEFMTDNEGGLRDADGDSSDWIEVYLAGPTPLNLAGWFLTDSANTPDKWRLPATNLAAGTRLIVFASGKDRSVSGAELHTNFKLKKEGGYLALVRPDGRTPASAWTYPAQRANASYGTGTALASSPLIAPGTPARWLVPSSETPGWETVAFDDLEWTPGVTGLGFDQNLGGGGLLGFWDFNDADDPGRVPDQSGNDHEGTLVNAAFSPPGYGRTGSGDDRALTLLGNGIMSVAAAADGAFDSSATHNAIALSLWVNGDAELQPSADFLFYAGGHADGSGTRVLGAHLPWSDSVIYWDTVDCCDPGRYRVFVGEPNPARWEGRWNHYVFLKQGDLKEIWQNGTLLHQGLNRADFTPFRSLFLGGTAGAGNAYHGAVDDFAIWDGALTAAEITALAAGASPLTARKLTPWISTDVAPAMHRLNAGIYARIAFPVTDPTPLNVLLLRMRYDDGFVAYLNGVEVARRNAPSNPNHLSAATSARPGGAGILAEDIDLSPYAPLLIAGTNLLACHGLNSAPEDDDFLLLPELLAGSAQPGHFFLTATPGAPNGTGYLGFTADTQFTPKRGFYDTPLTATITCGTPNATIVWTTDGSDPSPTHGSRSPSPATVTINTTTPLRAIAFAPQRAPTNIDTHTYLFADAVAVQARPATIGPTWPDGHPADFEMDERLYAGALPGFTVREGLLALPSLCLTSEGANLWSAATGLYPNSNGRGGGYERPTSVEYLVPGQPLAGFSTRAGLRIHGNISRDKGFTPKHSFKLFFRSDYGATKLNDNLFGSGVATFDQLILRGGSTDTWPVVEWGPVGIGPDGANAYRWRRPWASYVRDQWVRNAAQAMGQPNARGHFVHLYLNGLYWGLYNVTEHPDEDFCADTFGGDAADWDTLKDFAELESGDLSAWNRLLDLAAAGLASNAQYFRLLGRNPDGTPNPTFEVLLNAPSLIDYMLLHIFIGADDWPNHNWWAGRRSRGPLASDGFRFFAWDQEISNENHTYTRTSWGYVYQDVNAANTPAQIYFAARSNPEFRLHFADRIQKHLFLGGALTRAANVARWRALTDAIDQAIVAESARWGDHQRPNLPYRREADWLPHLNYMIGTYWPNINAAALARFTDAGLWPATQTPLLTPFGGVLAINAPLAIANPNDRSTIHYTLDGSDPRAVGGAVAPGALTYAGPFIVGQPRTVRARARSDSGVWSALTEAEYSILPDSDHDALDDAWELAHGFAIGPNEAQEDADGDGHSNLLEYLAGTDPRSASSALRFDRITITDGLATFSFTARANRVYTLQRSADLESWSDIATQAAQDTDHAARFADPAGAMDRYYRLRSTQP